jgi:tRNA pseudouridine55 synthase
MATGVLPVFVGYATKACGILPDDTKAYIAGFQLGQVSDTLDCTGEILETHAFTGITAGHITEQLSGMTGDVMQLPPMYSAVKVGGRKLYEIARKGGEVERKYRKVTIYSLEKTGRVGNDVDLRIRCSKGTYIRTLCHDVGAALGCGGCMSALRRTAAGAFSLRDAHTLEDVQAAVDRGAAESLLLPVDTLFAQLPSHTLNAAAEKNLRNGNPVSACLSAGRVRLYGESGAFLALGEGDGTELKIIKRFYEV